MNRTFDLALSLGPTCRARYQLLRVYGESVCPSGIFDWQITRRTALVAYIRHGFQGAFDIADLTVGDKGVRHTRFRTQHPHEFPDGIQQQELALFYAEAKSRHDYLCSKTLALLRSNKRLLLTLSKRLPFFWLVLLRLQLRRSYPDLDFILLNGPVGDLPARAETWQGNDLIWDRHLSQFSARVENHGSMESEPSI